MNEFDDDVGDAVVALPTRGRLTSAQRQLANELETLSKRKRENRLKYYVPYPRQKEFHDAGAVYRERLFMAGNQLGKTLAGAAEFAMHLTGRYPEWWSGKRFDQPIRCWASGVTGISTRDAPQRLLLGDLGEHGLGMIPKDTIIKVDSSRGLPGAIDTVLVKHVSGGTSQLRFKSYELAREKWQGETLNLIWFDEEPPMDVYTEGLARLTARKGFTFVTFTPLQGMSDVVLRYLQDETKLRSVTRMSIEDAPHIDPEERERIIAMYPAHEREARTKGIPMMGSGRVFDIAEDAITCEPIPLPEHWPRICGMDFGWQHPTAAVWLAWDRDSDSVYLYDSYRQAEETLAVHAAAIRARGKWIPVAWPHDGLQHDKSSGQTLARLYEETHELSMLSARAEFEGGGAGVEAGIALMMDYFETGRFKIFSTQLNWFEELRMFHRKNGLIVKVRDDLMSATRYAMMMLRHAETRSEATKRWQPLVYNNAGIV